MASARLPKGRAPHRRDENARRAVMDAADDLTAERGFNATTIEGIAARAGVAKQTIYRWWTSKVDILLDTLIEDAASALPISDRGSAVEGMRRYLRALAQFLTKDDAGRVMLALIGEAQQDETVAALLAERYLTPQRRRERELLARGVQSGELAAGLDLDLVLDALLGPIVLRALMGTRIPRAFVDRLVDDQLGRHRLPAGD